MPAVRSLPDHVLARLRQALPQGWTLRGLDRSRLCTVAVDSSLLTLGPGVEQIRLPLRPEPVSGLKSSSAVLLMGCAAAVMADLTDAPEALYALARSMRIHPENLRLSRPVLEEREEQGVLMRIVRDGKQRRMFCLAPPDVLASRCPLILDGEPRPMTQEDRHALTAAESSACGLATALTGENGTEPMTYLGSLLIQALPNTAVLTSLDHLRQDGTFEITTVASEEMPSGADLHVSISELPGSAPQLIPPSPEAPGLYIALTALHDVLLHRHSRMKRRYRCSVLCCLLLMLTAALFIRCLPHPFLPAVTLFLLCQIPSVSAVMAAERGKFRICALLIILMLAACMTVSLTGLFQPLLVLFCLIASVLQSVLVYILQHWINQS